jgi:hypothetical protein
MKTARPCLAGLAALALAVTVTSVPAPVSGADQAPAEPQPKRDLNSLYAHTAIGAVIDANGGKVPATGAELVKVLAKLGDFVQLPVPFSAVALNSGLTHPRVIITMRPSTTPAPKSVFIPNKQAAPKPPNGFGGWGGWGGPSGTTKLIPQPPEPLNHLDTNSTQLQGRLFLAANTEVGDDGGPKVRTIEFLSWNTRKLKFDFGVIEGMGTDAPELKILDGVRCVTCHKGRGPILGVAPWSNTAHNNLVRKAAADALSGPHKTAEGEEVRGRGTSDGLNLDDVHGPEVDAAVRIGGTLRRDREIFKDLADSAEGRKALVLLFETILQRGPLEKHDKEIVASLNALPLARFVRNATTDKYNAQPSALRDYSPAGPLGREVVGVVGSGSVKNQVARYDDARAKGQTRLPSEYLPSNPKAFIPPLVRTPQATSEVVSAVLLAQTIGLTEKDRVFLADALDETVKRLNAPGLNRVTVANAIFSGPAFADVMKTGTLPDRDDFKDRFVAGIIAVLRSQKVTDDFWAARDTYASAPTFDPNAKPEKEVEALPSHACLRCHDVRAKGKAAFNPIPQLPFDPFDATGREAWVKGTDRKTRSEVLDRLVKRLSTDKDMPPEDSTEREMYRIKDPAALNAARDWLEKELKKVK